MTLSSRVEVFTQLACPRAHHTSNTPVPFHYGNPEPIPLSFVGAQVEKDGDDPFELPAPRCSLDPAVQADAARIQTMFTTIMGLLSALTTGWWGDFSERHGRTRVLAFSTFGLFLTDLTFVLVSTPSSVFYSHGHKLLLIAPAIEGLLGGWSSLLAGTSAYISDCTSSGSRASVFSRFTGVSLLGFSLGPIIGGWLIRHPIPLFSGVPQPGQQQDQLVTSVFWVAVILSFINFCLVLFVFPESVTREQQDLARQRAKGAVRSEATTVGTPPQVAEYAGVFARFGIIRDFLAPLAVFLPRKIFVEGSAHKRKDWSLTLLAVAFFGNMLSAGLYQIKYLYGKNVYEWGPEQLSYYISFMGGSRAVFLLLVFPLVISTFKPKHKPPQAPPVTAAKAVKPKPTKAHLAREIKFDLRLSRISLCIDMLANTAILLAPAPAYKLQPGLAEEPTRSDAQFQTSQALFVVSSSISAWGSGLVPAVQSLALCVLQARALLEAESGGPEAPAAVETGTGGLFGAFAVLQATGQMILGPMLFGIVYSGTVATYPKAVFVTAFGLLFMAFLATLFVRNPISDVNGKAPGWRRQLSTVEEEEERGRSRISKDLRGYGSTSEVGSPPQQLEQGPSSNGAN